MNSNTHNGGSPMRMLRDERDALRKALSEVLVDIVATHGRYDSVALTNGYLVLDCTGKVWPSTEELTSYAP